MNRKSSSLLLILPLFAVLLILLLRMLILTNLYFVQGDEIAKDVFSWLAILSGVAKKGMGCFVLLGDVLYGPHANTLYLMQLEQVF